MYLCSLSPSSEMFQFFVAGASPQRALRASVAPENDLQVSAIA